MSNDVESAPGARPWEQPIAWFVIIMAIAVAVPFAIAAFTIDFIQGRQRDQALEDRSGGERCRE